VLVFAAGAGVEEDEEPPVERDVVVVVPAVAAAEELAADDPGEADADPDIDVDDDISVSDVGAAEDDDDAADEPAGWAAAHEQTALAADWTWSPVTGPHVLSTQFSAAVMMAADAEDEHWHA
jgi:hypothetical protein